MRRWRIAVPVLLACLVPAELSALDVAAAIKRGVALHDAGDYEGAIQTYRAVLEVEPENVLALYELANSSFAIGDFDSCIAAAEKGLKHESKLEAAFHTVAGSCYDASGETKKALKTFRAGLKIAPENAHLNFNYAIALLASGDSRAAIEYFERAIDGDPGYASPYYYLAEVHRRQGARVPSFFYFTRFFTLEPDSERGTKAAIIAFSLLFSGIEKGSEKHITVTVPPTKKKDPMGPLEMSLSIAGASIHTDEVAALPSEAHREVEVLTTFLQITLEMSEPDDQGVRDTVVWRQAIAPILRIHQQEGTEALGFMMAKSAGLEGATGWLAGNQEQVEALEDLLREPQGR